MRSTCTDCFLYVLGITTALTSGEFSYFTGVAIFHVEWISAWSAGSYTWTNALSQIEKTRATLTSFGQPHIATYRLFRIVQSEFKHAEVVSDFRLSLRDRNIQTHFSKKLHALNESTHTITLALAETDTLAQIDRHSESTIATHTLIYKRCLDTPVYLFHLSILLAINFINAAFVYQKMQHTSKDRGTLKSAVSIVTAGYLGIMRVCFFITELNRIVLVDLFEPKCRAHRRRLCKSPLATTAALILTFIGAHVYSEFIRFFLGELIDTQHPLRPHLTTINMVGKAMSFYVMGVSLILPLLDATKSCRAFFSLSQEASRKQPTSKLAYFTRFNGLFDAFFNGYAAFSLQEGLFMRVCACLYVVPYYKLFVLNNAERYANQASTQFGRLCQSKSSADIPVDTGNIELSGVQPSTALLAATSRARHSSG